MEKEDKIEKKRNLSSDTLFQYTGSSDTIERILEGKNFWPRYSTQYNWNGYQFAIPVCCFCDIPLSKVLDHVSFYGKFGIGMKKSWAVDNKFTPTVYVGNNSHMFNKYKNIVSTIASTGLQKKDEDDIRLLFLLKRISGKDYRLEKENDDYKYVEKGVRKFYDEREWRFVPTLTSYAEYFKISKEKYTKEEIDKFSNETKDLGPKFKFSDINYIVVDTETSRRNLIHKLSDGKNSGKFGFASEYEQYLLMSKILSCEQIKNDF